MWGEFWRSHPNEKLMNLLHFIKSIARWQSSIVHLLLPYHRHIESYLFYNFILVLYKHHSFPQPPFSLRHNFEYIH